MKIKKTNNGGIFKIWTISFLLLVFFGISNKNASADSCGDKFGDTYACLNISLVSDKTSCKGACPSNPSSNSTQCCLITGNFSAGGCQSDYICVDKNFISNNNIGKCPSTCTSQTTATGRCCPTNLFPATDVNVSNQTNNTISTNDKIPGSTESGGLVQCGRGGQRMCTLCDLIVGINILIKYGFRISIFVALAAITIAGVLYIVGEVDRAKAILWDTLKGIVFVFAAWLIVNYVMILLGTKTNLGITQVGSWSNFQCK